MTTTLKPVDAVLVGFGWTGAIMGQQLCDAGLNVVAFERGPWRDTATDFATGFAQDELRYMWRHHLFQNVADDTLTIRNNVNQDALPMRHLGSFLLGTGVGSGGVHWNGQIWRFLPSDFLTKSHNQQRYGKKAVSAYDMTVQDWGVTYDELEPYYDQFDKICGTSGKAGNLQGKIQPGGNPFEGARANEYPTPPMIQTYGPTLFGKAGATLSRTRREICQRPMSIRSARSWVPAPIAASAKNLAAATTPRPARRPPSCPISCVSRTSP
jgi:gluconate 2-dehydrogenase alpha chain